MSPWKFIAVFPLLSLAAQFAVHTTGKADISEGPASKISKSILEKTYPFTNPKTKTVTQVAVTASSIGEDFQCPKDVRACAENAAMPPVIVLDPGHNDTNAGNRSDFEKNRPSKKSSKPEEPKELPKLKRSAKKLTQKNVRDLNNDERSKDITDPLYSKYLHEGKLNMATSLIAKIMLEKCILKNSNTKVELTRWPGEKDLDDNGKNGSDLPFGAYAHPEWAEIAKKETGLDPVQMAELPHEYTEIGDTPNNPDFFWHPNQRVGYINYLVGAKVHFPTSAVTQEELNLEMPRSPGEINPYELNNPSVKLQTQPFFLSIHENTDPHDSKTEREDESLILFPRTKFTYHIPKNDELRLNPKDKRAIALHNHWMDEEPTDFAKILGEALQNSTDSFYKMLTVKAPFDPDSEIPFRYPDGPPKLTYSSSSLALMGPNVQVPLANNCLMEVARNTGWCREPASEQIKAGKRFVRAEITGPLAGKTNEKTVTYYISDLQIEGAKAVVTAFGKRLCPKK